MCFNPRILYSINDLFLDQEKNPNYKNGSGGGGKIYKFEDFLKLLASKLDCLKIDLNNLMF